MTPKQIALVQMSWRAVTPTADGLALLFYGRLFQTTPATRVLFARINPAVQRQKLIAALGMIVEALDGLDAVAPAVAALGKRHAGYGVEDQHYDAVGAALLWALEATLGELWASDIQDAWSNAFGAVADIMRSAARSVPNSSIQTSEWSGIEESQKEA